MAGCDDVVVISRVVVSFDLIADRLSSQERELRSAEKRYGEELRSVRQQTDEQLQQQQQQHQSALTKVINLQILLLVLFCISRLACSGSPTLCL